MSDTQTLQTNEAATSADGSFADVLCAIRGKEGGFAAVQQAASLAGTQGRLTLLAVTSHRSGGSQRGPAIGPAEATEILDHAKGVAREMGTTYTTEVDPRSPPARVILDWSAGYDLLALGAPASSWPAMWLSVGVGNKAIEGFTTPLLVARPLPPDRHFADNIVVATDGLGGSNTLVDVAAQIARAHASQVTLVHALGRESPLKRGGPTPEQQRALDEQDGLLKRTLTSGSSRLRVEPGRAADVIRSVAAEGASLVVMGSRRLDGLRAMGSVSRRVVHQASCSVLLVPPETLTS